MNGTIEEQTLNPAFRSGARTLENKCALVFGGAVAREFASEAAKVFLAGRTKSGLEAVAQQIIASGGTPKMATIYVLDDAAVNQYIDSIVKQAGRIDIVVDAAGPLAREYGNGKMAVELPIEEFMVPLTTMVKSRFITARAAARHMIEQKFSRH